jgi:hypothetical protein
VNDNENKTIKNFYKHQLGKYECGPKLSQQRNCPNWMAKTSRTFSTILTLMLSLSLFCFFGYTVNENTNKLNKLMNNTLGNMSSSKSWQKEIVSEF